MRLGHRWLVLLAFAAACGGCPGTPAPQPESQQRADAVAEKTVQDPQPRPDKSSREQPAKKTEVEVKATVPVKATAPIVQTQNEEQRSKALAVKYQGHDASQWAAQLADADPEISRQAVSAMSKIGDESMPFAMEAFKSPLKHVRQHALQIGTADEHKKTLPQWMPIYRAALKDKSPNVRVAGAQRIYETQCVECYADLQAAFRIEIDTDAKLAMQYQLKLLKL